jgi:outer membrane receptor protein involved in Fe transport
MRSMCLHKFFAATTSIVLLGAVSFSFADDAVLKTSETTDAIKPSSAQGDIELDTVQVTAERFSKIRNGLSPDTGGSVYQINKNDIATLPEGDGTAFNQVLLHAPGVANDSFGQLHVRGDHGNLQYRINGVILPEGISGFGQSLDTRFAENINLLTGALPAQFGYRTAGIVDIQTKTSFEPGSRISLYGGGLGTVNPSFELENSHGDLNYFITGSYLANDIGIENPTSSRDPIHDHTEQYKGFGYFSYLLNPTTQLVAMFGAYEGKFQIPNNPGQAPDANFLAAANLPGFNSSSLNERQRELNQFGILALQSSIGANIDYQVSVFSRYTSVHFVPDPLGDLVFNGVASDVLRSSFSNGLQADGSYRWGDRHTLRMGLFASTENVRSDNTSTVFPTTGGVASGPAIAITDNTAKNDNTLLGFYVQDEWKATDRLTVNYGLRADQMDAYIQAGQISPRLGMVFKLTPQTTVHAAYARYFTPPPTELISNQSLALYNNTSNAPASDLNGAVRPERSNYFDLGIDHQLMPGLSLGVDSFYKQIRNLIDEGQFGQALIFTPFNYAQGKIYGVELTASYKQDNFSAYANLARTTSLAKDINSAQFNFNQDELDYIATHWVSTDHDQRYTASAGASYLWMGNQLSIDALYGSGLRRGFANTEHLPGYTQVNLGLSRQFDTATLGKLEGRLAVINLFDKVYELRDGSGIGVGAPQFGPRRTLYVGISKSF